ncbi:putative transposase YbfD/YdcC [Phyllobacterium sp. 1468]|nr:putative transposase YbfD/YdcC [Phyllobacterium sp. 1468]
MTFSAKLAQSDNRREAPARQVLQLDLAGRIVIAAALGIQNARRQSRS